MLHLIFQSPPHKATLQRIGKNDAVLFLENSLIHLLKNSACSFDISAMLAAHSLFVLVADIETRGIKPEELVSGITVIDYAAWVVLTTEHQPIQSWF